MISEITKHETKPSTRNQKANPFLLLFLFLQPTRLQTVVGIQMWMFITLTFHLRLQRGGVVGRLPQVLVSRACFTWDGGRSSRWGIPKLTWSHEKKKKPAGYVPCQILLVEIIGILIMVYCNPHITRHYNPQKNTTQPGDMIYLIFTLNNYLWMSRFMK